MAKKIGVIIPAAGAGKRLGGISKPLIEIGGKPIILRLFTLFARLRNVTKICVAVPVAGIAHFKRAAELSGFGEFIEIVEGGVERSISVRNAYRVLGPLLSDDDLVCIHDAARPLLSEPDLARVIKAGWEHGAAFLASRVKDTLKLVDDEGFCATTIDRSRVFAAQTPQVMKSEFMRKAYEKVSDYVEVTDEIMLMEKIGVKAFVVEPRHLNLKLTTPVDLELIEKLIS